MDDDSPHVAQARAIYLALRETPLGQMSAQEWLLYGQLEEVFDLKLMRQRRRLELLDERTEWRRITSASCG